MYINNFEKNYVLYDLLGLKHYPTEILEGHYKHGLLFETQVLIFEINNVPFSSIFHPDFSPKTTHKHNETQPI